MLWDCWLILCSTCELACVALVLARSKQEELYWLCVAAMGGYLLVYYCVALYVAFSPSFAAPGKKLLNVCYLWTLYLLCSLLKIDPYGLRWAFRVDGMVAAVSPQRHWLLAFHVASLSLPVLGVVLYTFLASKQRHTVSIIDLGVMSVLGVALLTYTAALAARRKQRVDDEALFGWQSSA